MGEGVVAAVAVAVEIRTSGCILYILHFKVAVEIGIAAVGTSSNFRAAHSERHELQRGSIEYKISSTKYQVQNIKYKVQSTSIKYKASDTNHSAGRRKAV